MTLTVNTKVERDASPLTTILRKARAQPLGVAALLTIVAFIIVAILAPLIAPYDPAAQQVGPRLGPPSTEHWFGTDQYGRDILSRVLYGARISLSVSFGAVMGGAIIGSVVGIVGGYFGGVLDAITMRLSDVVLAYPGILLGVVVVAVMGPGTWGVSVAVAVASIPIFARLARAGVLSTRSLEYVDAARTFGAGPFRIMFGQIVPNILGPIIAQVSISMSIAVSLEASLSFLGLGAQPPTPSWGSMLNESRAFLQDAPTFGIFPGLTLAILTVALTFLGDILRDILDPRR